MHFIPPRLTSLLFAGALLIAAAPDARPSPPAGKATNRLAKESSPYLLQHAHNPVDWFPWGPEAFAKAKRENKLVFLSIGYSSCHWCHVMERESFANADVARLMNDSFVCIKVDREERPDIDQVYMTALHVFGVQGGWPLSMFLTPDGKPIVGGTYWPPEDREVGGEKVRGFKSILRLMLELEKERPQELRDNAEKVARATAQALGGIGKVVVGPIPGRLTVAGAVEQLLAQFDPVHGGFGNPRRDFRGTKFPMPSHLLLLVQHAERTNASEAQKVVATSLEKMARGGIYDQLGGGFHRYSTERTWTVPHFEKMLYDNAQLVEVYARAYATSQNPQYRRVVVETLDFVRRELTTPEGAFYSALDADTDGEEGKYYVWTADEIDAALTNAADRSLVRAAFGIGEKPNFEGKAHVLILARPIAELAGERKAAIEQVSQQLDAARHALLAVRGKRPRPFLDTKVLTGWNGQMIAGYAAAGQFLKEPRYVEAAAKAADFLLRNLRSTDGRLLRTFAAVPGAAAQARVPAYLDDYAYLVHGLLGLHDATGATRWLDEARALTETMLQLFGDGERAGFFYTASDAEQLFARAKDQHDGAQPSGNSVAIANLLRLATKTGEARYRALAGRTLRAFGPALDDNPQSLTLMVAALQAYLDGEPSGAPQGQPPQAGGAKRSDSVVKAKATAEKPDKDGKQVVTVTLTVDKGWHIYANPVGNENQESSATTVSVTSKTRPKSVKVEYPKGKTVKDPLIGDYTVYEGEVVIKATLERAAGDAGALDVAIKLQSCNDSTCLLPATIKLSVP